MAFSGPGCKYYVLLCDGMGTGLGAAHEGNSTAELLRQMLCAGFPAEHAFRSINSVLALRGQAGAVTLDLAEVRLDTGRIALYKWGAAPSWILRKKGAEKIGTATPPPGITVENARETVLRLSLRRGEALILLSDGVEVGETLRRMELTPDAPPGEVAQTLLNCGCRGEDDASAAVIRLQRLRG
jgi:stage II sporulation protein E